MTRFLHSADWQVGRQFSTLDPENAPMLAAARIDTVERLARLAVEHQVDAVLVAGDVFDAQTVTERTLRRLFKALTAFTGPWLLIPGNHDAALAESVWTRAERLGVVPPNVHLLLAPRVREYRQLGFAVLPAPLTQRHTYEDLTAWFDAADTAEGLLRIGLAHGSVQGILPDTVDSPNPIAPDRADRARLDYLALGDWHGCKRIDARTWYAGTPEPDRFRAAEAGQALVVDIAGPGAEPRVEPLAVGQYRWQSWAVTVQVDSDRQALQTQLESLEKHDVIDLRVDGEIDLAGMQALQQALGQAQANAHHLQADLSALRLMPTAEDIAGLQADGYLADLITDLRTEQQSADPAAARTAQDALALLASELAQRAPAPEAAP